MLLASLALMACTVDNYRDEPSSRPRTPTTITDYCIETGRICKLADAHVFNPDVKWIPTATSLKAYEELHKVLIAGDIQGVFELVASRDVLHTEVGDGIRVLDVSVWDLPTEGRMTSGKYNGMKVWVTAKWVVP